MAFFKAFLQDDAKVRETSDKVFDQFDADKSGQLNAAELTEAAKTLVAKIPGCPEIPPSAIEKVVSTNDTDKSGGLSKDEFFQFSKTFLGKLPF